MNVSQRLNVNATLKDQKGYSIDSECFAAVVKQNCCNENFEINVFYDLDFSKMDKIVTPWVIFCLLYFLLCCLKH